MSGQPLQQRRDTAWLLAGLLALAAWEASGGDLTLARLHGGPAGFVWRDAFLTSSVLHRGGRGLAWAALGALLWDAVRPMAPGPTRRKRWFWLAVIGLALLLVPWLKRLSATSCPWDLLPFGGTVPYVPHWPWRLADGGAGHCFPSGHAVAAFAYFGLYFEWRPHRPQAARRALLAVLLIGGLFGWAQMARGAHFLSHIGWSAWICWALCVAADWFDRTRLRGLVERAKGIEPSS